MRQLTIAILLFTAACSHKPEPTCPDWQRVRVPPELIAVPGPPRPFGGVMGQRPHFAWTKERWVCPAVSSARPETVVA